MWNAFAEWSREPIAKPSMAASSDAFPNNVGTKRQRRPSVRLGEIGYPPAAIISEPYFKRKKQSVAFAPLHMTSAGLGDDDVNFEGNGTIDSSALHSRAAKFIKTRPLGHAINGNFHEQDSSNDGGDTQGHFRTGDHVPFHALVPFENPLEVQLPTQGVAGGKPEQFVKVTHKKVRNWKRRRGGNKGSTFVNHAISSVADIDDNDNEKLSGMDDTTDPLSDEAYDAETPEGFRDCDLEPSEFSKDVKEISNSRAVGLLDTGNVNFHRRFQVAGEHCLQQEQDHVERSEGREGTANNQVEQTGYRRETLEPCADAEENQLIEANAPLHECKGKVLKEENENLEIRERASENAEQHFQQYEAEGRQCPSISNGVKGWLQGLGLAKYAPLFETHEVDTEVLPLLTLDDLKEMGVSAVGTRRKMFYAIQQLGKGLMGRADSF